MVIFDQEALELSVTAVNKCIDGIIDPQQITHLITISCTGMSAPGLDLQLMQQLSLPATIFRTSINFMGCYAAIHGLKIAKMICDSTPGSNVMVVATELCTLHFQKEFTEDNAASSLLFAKNCIHSGPAFLYRCALAAEFLTSNLMVFTSAICGPARRIDEIS